MDRLFHHNFRQVDTLSPSMGMLAFCRDKWITDQVTDYWGDASVRTLDGPSLHCNAGCSHYHHVTDREDENAIGSGNAVFQRIAVLDVSELSIHSRRHHPLLSGPIDNLMAFVPLYTLL